MCPPPSAPHRCHHLADLWQVFCNTANTSLHTALLPSGVKCSPCFTQCKTFVPLPPSLPSHAVLRQDCQHKMSHNRLPPPPPPSPRAQVLVPLPDLRQLSFASPPAPPLHTALLPCGVKCRPFFNPSKLHEFLSHPPSLPPLQTLWPTHIFSKPLPRPRLPAYPPPPPPILIAFYLTCGRSFCITPSTSLHTALLPSGVKCSPSVNSVLCHEGTDCRLLYRSTTGIPRRFPRDTTAEA